MFRPVLTKALRPGAPLNGGRSPSDPILNFKRLVLQSLHGLRLARTSYMVRDRLSWMRFCGLWSADHGPGANTVRDFGEALIKVKALDKIQAMPA